MIQKNGIFAVLAGAGVVAVVLMAGLAVNTASGQQTDEIFVPSLPAEEAADDPIDVGEPPASPIEPVSGPITDPDGGPAADSGAPSALPDTGRGPADGSAAGYVAVLSLIAVAGLAVVGASALARTRRV
jgi:hypothetical protein